MKNSKSDKYKTYGPLPQNEYTKDLPNTNTEPAGFVRTDPTPEEAAYRRRLKNRQAVHPSGRRKILGWARTWKANGWRAESAALHDEVSDMGRDSTNV